MPKQEPEIKRGRGRPRGVSPKVAGRNRTLREIAGMYGEEAVNVLARVAMDEDAPHAARVSAANALLDRAYGKPAQANPTDQDTPDQEMAKTDIGKLKGLSDAALEEIARAEAKAGA